MPEIKVIKTKKGKKVKENDDIRLSKSELKEIVSNLESQVQEAVQVFQISAKMTQEQLIKTISEFMSKQPCKAHISRMDVFEKRLNEMEEILRQHKPVKYWIFKTKLWFWQKSSKVPIVVFSGIVVFLYLWFLTDIMK